MKQPNVLFIMADQMTASALPVYGNNIVKAPHISGMAENGVVFENAYCNNPLCAPSRFSMLTGRFSSGIGAYDNCALFPSDLPTMAHCFRAAGYHTCLSGKMHFIGPDQLHGFEERLTTDIYPADFGWVPDWENFDKRPSWYHNLLSVVQAGTCAASNQLDFDEEVDFHSTRRLFKYARERGDRPFFFLVSFTHPHDPFAITPEYWNRYRHEDIDLPAVSPISHDEQDPHSRRVHHVCTLGEYDQTDERVRNARHAYYGAVSYIDDKVGRLLSILKQTGLADNTLVIFASDHGEMLGERGLWYKMAFFENAGRVPMIFHAPRRFQPRRVKQPVSLVDLLPTLTDFLSADTPLSKGLPKGLSNPDTLDGQSLIPLMEGNIGRKGEGRGDENLPPVFSELLGESAVSPVLMIRRGPYKFIFSKPDPDQLYDLESDPRELDNLAGLPEYGDMCHEFRRRLEIQFDPEKLHKEVIASQKRRRFVYAALRKGQYHAWDFQPEEDAGNQYMRNHLDLNALEKSARYPSPEIPKPDGSPRKEDFS